MGKEIEASFYNVNRDAIVRQLNALGARPAGNYDLRRINFQVATRGKAGEADYYTCWARVRSDGGKTTLTVKEQNGNEITGREEYEIETGDFEMTVKILSRIMPSAKYDYFENHREIYDLDALRFFIDKFPDLPYLLEIEGNSKEAIDSVLEKMEIGGEPDVKKSVPTSEYYRMHGADYSKVQNGYIDTLARLID